MVETFYQTEVTEEKYTQLAEYYTLALIHLTGSFFIVTEHHGWWDNVDNRARLKTTILTDAGEPSTTFSWNDCGAPSSTRKFISRITGTCRRRATGWNSISCFTTTNASIKRWLIAPRKMCISRADDTGSPRRMRPQGGAS